MYSYYKNCRCFFVVTKSTYSYRFGTNRCDGVTGCAEDNDDAVQRHFVKSKFREVYRRISGASRGFDGAKVETFCLSGISGSPLVTLNYSYIALRKLSRHPSAIYNVRFPASGPRLSLSFSSPEERRKIRRVNFHRYSCRSSERLISFPLRFIRKLRYRWVK